MRGFLLGVLLLMGVSTMEANTISTTDVNEVEMVAKPNPFMYVGTKNTKKIVNVLKSQGFDIKVEGSKGNWIITGLDRDGDFALVIVENYLITELSKSFEGNYTIKDITNTNGKRYYRSGDYEGYYSTKNGVRLDNYVNTKDGTMWVVLTVN